MEPTEGTERDQLYQELEMVLRKLETYSEQPQNRARRLSLAITNVEQGAMWLREHIVYDRLPGEDY